MPELTSGPIHTGTRKHVSMHTHIQHTHTNNNIKLQKISILFSLVNNNNKIPSYGGGLGAVQWANEFCLMRVWGKRGNNVLVFLYCTEAD